jgi:hypothetical protein
MKVDGLGKAIMGAALISGQPPAKISLYMLAGLNHDSGIEEGMSKVLFTLIVIAGLTRNPLINSHYFFRGLAQPNVVSVSSTE